MKAVPRDEQEVILNYDRELDKWHLYSDVPKFNRKWKDKVQPECLHLDDKDNVVLIDGYLLDSSTVSIIKRREMTDEQRKKAAERLKNNLGR